jgi:TonB family protein
MLDEMRHFVRDDKPGGYMSKTVLALALACAGCASIASSVTAQDSGQAAPGGVVIAPPPPPPPAPPPPPSGVQNPAYQSRQVPIYPGFDAIYGIEGSTTLLILVGASGQPKDIKVQQTSGYRDMDMAALNAAIHWRFTPELKNGVPVDGYVRVPVNFSVNRHGDSHWPKQYFDAPYVLDDAPVPYTSVNQALSQVALLAHADAYDDQAIHFQILDVYGQRNTITERWYFMDVSSTRAIAVRYTFAGTPEHPVVKVSALCDRAVVCQDRMRWIMAGPHPVRPGGSAMASHQ